MYPFASNHDAARQVQVRDEIRIGLVKLVAKQFEEEMVITIPMTFVVQWYDEQVCAFQFIQYFLAVFLIGNKITERF